MVACALIAGAFSAAEAHGYTNYYCGVLLNSGSWCGDGSNHTYDSNRAEYSGAGLVDVCARLLYADSINQYKRECGVNSIWVYNGTNTTTLLEAEIKHESGTARHTLYGTGIY